MTRKPLHDDLGKFKDMSEEERQEISRIVGLGALKYFILYGKTAILLWRRPEKVLSRDKAES